MRVGDVYIADLGGGGQERARREPEREAERRRLADRYARYLLASAEVGEATARRVITALFDPGDAAGNECPCSCHPRLSAEHGDGFDCRCRWDEDRRAAEAADWQAWWDSPQAAELSAAHQREEDAIAAWLASQPGVDARRISSYAPEQWEGTVDGRTFYFRERGGSWRIELDMVPSGKYASACSGSAKTAGSSPSRCRSWKATSSRRAPIPISVPRRLTISRSSSGRSVITCAVLAADTMGHGCSARTAGSGWVEG